MVEWRRLQHHHVRVSYSHMVGGERERSVSTRWRVVACLLLFGDEMGLGMLCWGCCDGMGWVLELTGDLLVVEGEGRVL